MFSFFPFFLTFCRVFFESSVGVQTKHINVFCIGPLWLLTLPDFCALYYTKSRKSLETCRIGTPSEFIYGGCQTQKFHLPVVPNSKISSMGCQHDREKIEFLPSAAGARKNFLVYKTDMYELVLTLAIQKCNKNRNPMNLERFRGANNFSNSLAPPNRGCQTQTFHLPGVPNSKISSTGGAKLENFIYRGCHATCFGAFAWLCINWFFHPVQTS